MSAGVCGNGMECLANRCVPTGGEPVSPKSTRTVLEPTRMAVVSSEIEPGPLPTVITFGSHARGATRLMLEFGPRISADKVEAAFLLLEPAQGVARGIGDIEVDAWRMADPWDDSALSWVRGPKLVRPHAAGIARPRPPTELRIDVTRIVAYLAAHPEAYPALAVVAGAGSDAGVSFATGVASGRGPRLEIYSR